MATTLAVVIKPGGGWRADPLLSSVADGVQSEKGSPGAGRDLAGEGTSSDRRPQLPRMANGLGVVAASAGKGSRTDHPDFRRGIHACRSIDVEAVGGRVATTTYGSEILHCRI
jgi:hypothetical protein